MSLTFLIENNKNLQWCKLHGNCGIWPGDNRWDKFIAEVHSNVASVLGMNPKHAYAVDL